MAAANKPKQPKKLLDKALDDYYFTRMKEKAESYGPIYDDVAYAPATEMERARREIACLDHQLVIARQEWMQQKEGLDARWKNCAERFNSLYENIPKFNGYFRDSFAKRERSIHTYLVEKEQSDEKDKEIRRLRRETAKLYEVKKQMENRLEKFSVFRTYLDKVKQSSQGEYQDIREIIDRYSVLAEARNSLRGKNEETRESVARRQKALDNDIITKSNEVLAYRNYLSELLEYQNQLQEQAQRLDESLLRIKTTAAQRTMIIGQIKMSIDNLYKQVCKSMHRYPKIDAADTIGQLTDVGLSVREMFKLSKDIKHMLKAAFATAEAEKAAKARALRKEEERKKRMDKFINNRAGLDVRDLFQLPPLAPEARKQEMVNIFVNAATGATAQSIQINSDSPATPGDSAPARASIRKSK